MEDKEREKIKEELNKKDSETIRKELKIAKEKSKQGWKIIEKRKDTTKKEIFAEWFDDMLSFSPAVIFFGLFFMGALGARYNIPSDGFFYNATENINRVANITISKFYYIGYEKPMLYTILFYFTIFMAFIYPLIRLIYYIIKNVNKKQHNKS